MATTITFENEFEQPVTAQQMQLLDSYHKVVTVDGLVKKKEEYANNQLTSLLYYLDAAETEAQAVSAVMAAYHPAEGFEIRKREAFGSLIKETNKAYSTSGVYQDYVETILLDNQGRQVYQKTESTHNTVTTVEVKKFYYDTAGKNFMLLYDNTNALLGMKGDDPPFVADNDYFIPVQDFPLYFPNFLTANPYYSNANP